MGKNIGENISKSFSGNYSEKLLDHAKQYATDAFITASKREFQKTTESTGDLIGNTRLPNERNISPEKMQEIIDKLILI